MAQIAVQHQASVPSQVSRPWNSPASLPQRMSVLIVEDNKAEQAILRARLRNFGYRVYCADQGNQALSLLRCEPIDLVVSDWRMPGLTGPELCQRLRSDPTLRQPYFILLTGSQSETDLVAGMDVGADDFIGKPYSTEELRVRLQAGARIMRLRAETEQKNRLLAQHLECEAAAHRVLRKDLDAAARMQQRLLPAEPLSIRGIEFATLLQPAATVAGDHFNLFLIDERHLAFYHIDVAGHGVAAAMLSFTIARLLSPGVGEFMPLRQNLRKPIAKVDRLPMRSMAPEDIVKTLNQRFFDEQDCGEYFTIVYGILDVRTGTGRLCQAGHPHPLIVSAAGETRRLGDGGFPVGLFTDARYEGVDFQLNRGDRLVVYSDGITDCRDAHGMPFTIDKLTTLLSNNRARTLPECVRSLYQQLRRWRGDKPQEDDVSLLALGRCSRF